MAGSQQGRGTQRGSDLRVSMKEHRCIVL